MRASIIIAAHNEGERLVRTVESVVESAGGLDYEIIVADDASDDGSIEETVRRFPRVRVVRHDPKVASSLRERASSRDTSTDLSRSESPRPLGCSPTKDLGARHARGEVLVFLDGHTLPEKDAIRRLVEDVERTGGQAIITPCIVGLDAERWKLNRSQRGHGYRLDLETMSAGWLPLSHLKPVRQGGRDFYESPAFIGCAFAMSRELYDKLHGFDPHMFVWGVEDVDLALRCWLLGHAILHDPEPCIGHRFRRTFDNYEVPREHVVANQIRMAYKCMSPSIFAAWLDRQRQRYSVPLPDHPEGLFTAGWTLFESHRPSAESQRAHLHARRVHDELWYATRFQLPWPRLAGEGREPGGEMFALMEGTSAPPPPCSVTFDHDPVTTGYTKPVPASVIKRTVIASVEPAEMAAAVELNVVGVKRVTIENVVVDGEEGTVTFDVKGKTMTPEESVTPEGEPIPDCFIQGVVDDTVCREVPVLILVPRRIERAYPEAVGHVAPENVAVHFGTSPAMVDVKLPLVELVTVYGHVLAIRIEDQFGQVLNGLYEGARVEERLTPTSSWFDINQPLNSEGTYHDPVGWIAQRTPLRNIVHHESDAARGWPESATHYPMRNIVYTQKIRLRVGGHLIVPPPGVPGPAIRLRKVTCTHPGGVPHVKIEWPSPEDPED
jgi:GT2 family glycosyltransferase